MENYFLRILYKIKMPFRKKAYRRKRNYRRGSKMPFSKRQTNVIKSLALKQTEKTRETKSITIQMDEVLVPIGGQGVIESSALTNPYVLNYMQGGNMQARRVGNQIHPVSFNLKGWSKINGTSSSSSSREIALRVCLGYVDNDTLQTMETSLNSVPLFWTNNAVVPAGDYKDAIRPFSWKAFKPIYDRVHKVRPNYTQADGDSTSLGKDYCMLNIRHKFSKTAELRLDSINNDCWQKQNLVMIVFSRLMNDDTAISTLAHEFCLEGNFYYTDA